MVWPENDRRSSAKYHVDYFSLELPKILFNLDTYFRPHGCFLSSSAGCGMAYSCRRCHPLLQSGDARPTRLVTAA